MNSVRLPTRVALHEAGHAVVILALGWTIARVTLEPDGETIGYVDWDVGDSPDGDRSDAAEAAVAVAGSLAEGMALGASGCCSLSGDDERALGEVVARRPADRAWLASAGVRVAGEVLRAEWPTVLLLAGELDRQSTLTGAEVEATMRKARRSVCLPASPSTKPVTPSSRPCWATR